ncbi:MAG: PAS domain S-box protein [Syntrophomonas sp.]
MLYEQILSSALIYEHIIESMHDGVITIDNSGTIIMVNPSAVKIFAIAKEHILNKKYSEVFFRYPENDDFNQVVLDAVYKSFMSHHRICKYYTGKIIKHLFVTTSILKVPDDNEIKTLGINVIFSDITEEHELRNVMVADKIKWSGILKI